MCIRDRYQRRVHGEYKLNEDHTLTYENIPMNTKLINDKIWVSFMTKVTLDNTNSVFVESNYFVENEKGMKDVGLYMCLGIVSASADLLSSIGFYNGNFKMSDFGYTGKIKDLFVAIPDLSNKYAAEEAIFISCDVDFGEKENGAPSMEAGYECKIIVDSSKEVVLSMEVDLEISLLPTKTNDDNQNFVALMKKSKVINISSYPRSYVIERFIVELFGRIFMKMHQDKLLNFPNVRYTPFRKPSSFSVPLRESDYVAYYDVTDSLSYQPKYF
eukprot:TRINITY_DN7084_c0_g1_i1.p1 TRINITY_DN7084_c0_g1~~TRINITY_DN7084_c0_g1_i1.p1  ORF type:complete len:272 (+),score=49.66 TRINITY_DN7084_c0_g1_i1:173-988(+)